MNKTSLNPANGPQGAVRRSLRPVGGEPKSVARKGVLSAVGSDPQTVTVTGITPGLYVQCDGIPVADWLCACGHYERARGRAAVIRLTARVRADTCPHLADPVEGRAVS